jgi:hypothetical protein
VLKVPKKITDIDNDQLGFLDLIFETQFAQMMKSNDESNIFFSEVEEEIFLVNPNTKTVLNYLTFVSMPDVSMINMLAGPTAVNYQLKEEDVDDEGYRSQEIFTQEKYFYLYYKGILLLENLFNHGIAHG